jgi:hypothetical protein
VLDSAISIYDAAQFDAASGMLHRALEDRGTDSLSSSRHAAALMYLGAIEMVANRRDSARADFRRAIVYDRRFRPDTLSFPRAVTSAYADVRNSLHGVALVRPSARGFDIIVLAVNPHRVTVDVRARDGSDAFSLYDGMVSDSLALSWDGRRPGKGAVNAGGYDVVVTVHGSNGAVLNVARLPMPAGAGADTSKAR